MELFFLKDSNMNNANSFRPAHIFSLLKETYKEWNDDEPFEMSSVVAYYAIFSLPALLVIIIAVAGLFFGAEAVRGQVSGQIGQMLGKDAGEGIQTMIIHAYKAGNNKIATIIGIITLLFGATGVFTQLQKSLNKIWNVKANPKEGWKRLVAIRATSLGLILAIGFLLLISLVITTVLAALGNWLTHMMPDFMLYAMYVVNFLLSLGIMTLLFAMIYKFLPDVQIQWKTVWTGAMVTALLFEIGKFALSIYFGKADPGSAYGAAGSVVLILLWVSYSCMILFFGAEFTQVYARRYGHIIEPSSHAIPQESCEVKKENKIIQSESEPEPVPPKKRAGKNILSIAIPALLLILITKSSKK
ncbi:MAG: YihY/virulence factor BrkB family protein [Cytophagaceae bacterium]